MRLEVLGHFTNGLWCVFDRIPL